MTTLFGMRIFPDRKKFTDDELVSQVRAFVGDSDSARRVEPPLSTNLASFRWNPIHDGQTAQAKA
jgi:hypothetical protein